VTGAEFDRLASAHWELIEKMIAEQPAAPAHEASGNAADRPKG